MESLQYVNYTLNTCSEKILGNGKTILESVIEITPKVAKHILLVSIIDFLDRHCDYKFENNEKKYLETGTQSFFEYIFKDENPLYKKGKVCMGKCFRKDRKNIKVTGDLAKLHEILKIGTYLTFNDDFVNMKWRRFLDKCYSVNVIDLFVDDFLSGLMYMSWIDETTDQMFIKVYGYMKGEEDTEEFYEITYEITNKKKFNLL